VGLEGLAPYWFEVEPTLLLSQDGDVSAELTLSHDSFVTQRLVLQPRLDVRAALPAVPDDGTGAGLNSAAFDLRIRYELRREYAPYVGVRLERSFAETARLARAIAKPVESTTVTAGLRMWF